MPHTAHHPDVAPVSGAGPSPRLKRAPKVATPACEAARRTASRAWGSAMLDLGRTQRAVGASLDLDTSTVRRWADVCSPKVPTLAHLIELARTGHADLAALVAHKVLAAIDEHRDPGIARKRRITVAKLEVLAADIQTALDEARR
jgi:hypothetical protein